MPTRSRRRRERRRIRRARRPAQRPIRARPTFGGRRRTTHAPSRRVIRLVRRGTTRRPTRATAATRAPAPAATPRARGQPFGEEFEGPAKRSRRSGFDRPERAELGLTGMGRFRVKRPSTTENPAAGERSPAAGFVVRTIGLDNPGRLRRRGRGKRATDRLARDLFRPPKGEPQHQAHTKEDDAHHHAEAHGRERRKTV